MGNCYSTLNCNPCPPCSENLPTTCEPREATTMASRLIVEDEAYCIKALASPSVKSTLSYDNGLIYWDDFTETPWVAVTSAYIASSGQKISANTSSGSFAITLPSSPSQFDEITFANHFNSWGVFNLTILRNGSLIEGIADDLVCNISWPSQIILRYEGSTWRTYEIL